VLDRLGRLRNSSLVAVEEVGPAMRYRLLETLREYGAGQLSRAERAALSTRHAEYFLRLAQQAEEQRTAGKQQAWAEALTRDLDNLRAALAWGLGAAGEAGIGVRLGAALWWFWPHQGRLPEGREWLDQALRHAGSAPSRPRAWLLLGTGLLSLHQGDFASAGALFQESLALFHAVDDPLGTAHALYHLGWVAHGQSDRNGARRLWEESLVLRRQLGLKADLVQSLRHPKWLAADLRDQTAAGAFYEEELAVMREFGGAAAAAAQLIQAVDRARARENCPALRLICAEALALWREFGNRQEIAEAFDYLAVTARDMGDYELARALLEQSLAIDRALGLEYSVHLSLWNLAQMARLTGDLTAARAWIEVHRVIVARVLMPDRRARVDRGEPADRSRAGQQGADCPRAG
jgi:tetratricopeptide (TPR) repeat protein